MLDPSFNNWGRQIIFGLQKFNQEAPNNIAGYDYNISTNTRERRLYWTEIHKFQSCKHSVLTTLIHSGKNQNVLRHKKTKHTQKKRAQILSMLKNEPTVIEEIFKDQALRICKLKRLQLGISSKKEISTNLYTSSEGKIQTPPMYQIILQKHLEHLC